MPVNFLLRTRRFFPLSRVRERVGVRALAAISALTRFPKTCFARLRKPPLPHAGEEGRKWSDVFRPLVQFLLRLCFRIEVTGVEHLREAGDRVLVIVNHFSYLDPLILAAYTPDVPAFAINVYQADKWYFRWLDRLAPLYRLDPLKPLSMKRLIQDLRGPSPICVAIFPEGRISTTGGLMKIYDGTGRILEKTGATLVAAHIDGTQYSRCSRMGGKLRRRWFPKVTLAFMPPVAFEKDKPVPAGAIRLIMEEAAFKASGYRDTFLNALLKGASLHGMSHVIAADTSRLDMNYRQLFTRAFILAGKLRQPLSGQKDVGMLLPNALGAMVTFTSLHMLGKIPCMLNYSAGKSAIAHTCRISALGTILTSRAFVEKAKLEEIIEHLAKEYQILYLEDIRPTVTLADKLAGLYRACLPRRHLGAVLAAAKPDDAAVVIYTSGSEGTPKGVALSHANILANIAQVFAILDITPADKLFNAMPVFHSFGLTVGLLLPMARGIRTFLYPSPLHFRVIPDLIYDTDSTVMLGTDTFYRGYAHYAHPYDFAQVRLAVAGAEKLKEATRRLYSDRFRLNILEGYGITETSPVLAVNTPMESKIGSVGKPLPCVECRLEKIEGLEHGGRLWVKGPNVMLGYLKADRPGVIQPQGEWYDTGDIVDIDEDGFITILGRAKRFAKIAGEMVSLSIVEELAGALFPEATHAAIAIPDERKGEQIALFTESPELTKEQLLRHAKLSGVNELSLAKHVIPREAIPRLGGGKVDYVTLAKEYKPAE